VDFYRLSTTAHGQVAFAHQWRGSDNCPFFGGIVRYGVLTIVLVMVLGKKFGVQTACILAALGAVGLVIDLVLQGTLQNIAAGIMLLIIRPFRIGKNITAGSIGETVQEIGLFTTELSTYDGTLCICSEFTTVEYTGNQCKPPENAHARFQSRDCLRRLILTRRFLS